MNKYYIYGKRQSLLILILAFTLLSLLVGYVLGYISGNEKARAEVPFIPNTEIRVKTVIPEVSTIEKTVDEAVNVVTPSVSDNEIDLIALITMAEAEGESEMGKRLVIDTILNRVDSSRFPNTIHDVIYAPGQFECTWNGRLSKCYVKDDIRNLVIEELENRTRSDIHYFRAGHYHGFGKQVTHVGNHYFSTY